MKIREGGFILLFIIVQKGGWFWLLKITPLFTVKFNVTMHNIVWEISKLSQFYNSGPPISLLEENSPLFDAFPTCARCYYTCPPPDQNSRSKIIYRFQIYESRFPGGQKLFPDFRFMISRPAESVRRPIPTQQHVTGIKVLLLLTNLKSDKI